ncbi:DUF4397 domain-containing protein [Pontibacillus marinus]|uniref:DUF4397 domain-containing protein n=1 Tax=Pontibacillus marinus BH030004 = DSM 16465 TaxID=1385511 RepID=A0A0A5GJT2_9BACI|nr:DUF4397 domain-containing protein [Pontibacillus marinus]KGX91425.1 hypothetical protein N783_07665 [Pontibacillus marinus BH030004 = DSM 16465]
MQSYERELAQKASMYNMLSNYYKYLDPQRHVMYYYQHLQCMNQLIHLQNQQMMGGYFRSEHNSSQQQSFVRAFHASPNAPAVDIYVNDQKLLENVQYKQTSDYIPVMPGSYRIKITPAGQSQAVLTQDVEVPSNAAITLAAAGNVEDLTLVPYQDDRTPVQEKAKARFIHLSPDAPAVDIAVKGGDVLFSNVGFKQSTDYLTLSPTTVDLEVRPAGSNQVVLTIPNVKLDANQIYNAVAVGYAQGSPQLEAIFI